MKKEGQIEISKNAETASVEELELINRFTRRQFLADEVYVFSAVLCDNEIDRDNEAFSPEALLKLKELFVGKTCILDHERKSLNQTARIFKTELETSEERLTSYSEKYVALKAKMYLPKTQKNEDIITAIESGILKEVSISCSVGKAVCSICGKNTCNHKLGREYAGKLCYRVLCEPKDAYECSFVAVPAQREAGVTKAYAELSPDIESPENLIKAISEKAVTQLSKAQAEEISAYVGSLKEKAAWGEEYRERLEKSTLRYGVLAQPELPRDIMKSSLAALGMKELAELEQHYKKAAAKRLPIAPQLYKTDDEKKQNTDYKI